MPTHTPAKISPLVEQLHALHVRVTVYPMPAGTTVDECRYRDHDTLTAIPAVTDVYPLGTIDPPLAVCLECAVHIATEQEIRTVEVKRIDNPTVTLVDDEPVAPAPRAAFIDRDGRFGTAEVVGVEFELNVGARPALRFDVSTPVGLAAARVLRAQLDAAIEAA